MKKFLILAALAAVLSYSGTRAGTRQAAATVTPAAEASHSENFTGTIMLLNGSLYILRDAENDSWYHLDDQQMPAKFLGKKVLVVGKLDAGVNVISVHDIEPLNG